MSDLPQNFGLDAVNISFLNERKLPLVISPRWDDSLDFLVAFCNKNRIWLDEQMVKFGAVLIRGFQVESPEHMERAIQSYHPQLCNTYRGTSPRNRLGDTDYVYSAAEVPTHYPIAQHIEMSFLDAPPAQLFFGCLQPAKHPKGGETALADFRQVARTLDPQLKQKFLDKGIRYVRTHKKEGAYFTFDVSDMLGWPELFGTDDKVKVEKLCAEEGTPVSWDDDTFVSTTTSKAFEVYGQSQVWFNHSQVFHWTTFPAELWFAWQRTGHFRLLLQFFIVGIFCLIKYGLLGHRMSLHVTFGDETEISAAEMSKVRSAIHKNMIFSQWQKGDILFIDNFCVSHGRQPTYDKGRKVAVAWSDPVPKTVAENPQERTPQNTLTKDGVDSLKKQLLNESEKETLRHLLEPNDETHAATMKTSVSDLWSSGTSTSNPKDC